MVFTTANSSSSSSPQENHDDISLFLRQILHRSSPPQPFTSVSSSSPTMRSHAPDHHQHLPCFSTLLQPHHQVSIPAPSAVFSGSDRLVVDRISQDYLNGVILPPSSGFSLPAGSNLSAESLSGSVQLRSSDNNEYAEDNECDSEEGNEVVAEEAEAKQQQSRNQFKRSRAAEVHNLSEKRRRSRINEKMKALQNLIPNSNKTDKASMLDEAIEYLKQLQLQVQMLSLRNGLNLHPMCLPGGQGIMHSSQLSQLGINFDNSGGSYDINMANTLNTIPETSTNMLNLSNECTSLVSSSLPIASTVTNSVAMSFGPVSSMPSNFGPVSSMPSNFRPFQPRNSPQAVCREQGIPHERLVGNNIEAKSLGAMTASTRPGHNPVEGRMQQKHGLQETLLQNIPGRNQLISSNFNGLVSTTSGAQMTS